MDSPQTKPVWMPCLLHVIFQSIQIVLVIFTENYQDQGEDLTPTLCMSKFTPDNKSYILSILMLILNYLWFLKCICNTKLLKKF